MIFKSGRFLCILLNSLTQLTFGVLRDIVECDILGETFHKTVYFCIKLCSPMGIPMVISVIR